MIIIIYLYFIHFTVRIVGIGQGRGRVEVSLGNGWGRVCDPDWSDHEAKTVCYHAGYKVTIIAQIGASGLNCKVTIQ